MLELKRKHPATKMRVLLHSPDGDKWWVATRLHQVRGRTCDVAVWLAPTNDDEAAAAVRNALKTRQGQVYYLHEMIAASQAREGA